MVVKQQYLIGIGRQKAVSKILNFHLHYVVISLENLITTTISDHGITAD